MALAKDVPPCAAPTRVECLTRGPLENCSASARELANCRRCERQSRQLGGIQYGAGTGRCLGYGKNVGPVGAMQKLFEKRSKIAARAEHGPGTGHRQRGLRRNC